MLMYPFIFCVARAFALLVLSSLALPSYKFQFNEAVTLTASLVYHCSIEGSLCTTYKFCWSLYVFWAPTSSTVI